MKVPDELLENLGNEYLDLKEGLKVTITFSQYLDAHKDYIEQYKKEKKNATRNLAV